MTPATAYWYAYPHRYDANDGYAPWYLPLACKGAPPGAVMPAAVSWPPLREARGRGTKDAQSPASIQVRSMSAVSWWVCSFSPLGLKNRTNPSAVSRPAEKQEPRQQGAKLAVFGGARSEFGGGRAVY
jgi:hypothetical protein